MMMPVERGNGLREDRTLAAWGRGRALAVLLMAAASGAWLLGLAATRRVDADEAYYLYAARLVSEGGVLYRDFFFPQMPLVPLLWGGTGWLAGGVDWIQARAMAALVAWAGALIFGWLCWRRGGSLGVAAAWLAIYLSADIGFAWGITVKVYGLATLMLLGAWALARPDGEARSWWRLWLGGVLAGLAILTRLTVAPLPMLMALALLAQGWPRRWVSWRPALCFVAGWIPPLLLLGWFHAQAPESFMYGNWWIHQLGADASLARRLMTNLPALSRQFIEQPAWVLAVALTLWRAWRRWPAWRIEDGFLVLALAALVGTASIGVRPFLQYLALATPWLLLLAAPAAAEAWRGLRRTGLRVGALAILLLVAAVSAHGSFQRYWRGGEVEESREFWLEVTEYDLRPGVVRWVGRRIDELAPPGAPVMSWWPGYLIGTRAEIVGGLHNHFAGMVERLDSAEQSRRLGLMTEAELEAAIRGGDYELVVAGIWTGRESGRGRFYYESLLVEAGYEPVDQIGSTIIWRRPAHN